MKKNISKSKIRQLESIAKKTRLDILKLIYDSKAAHLGSCFSIVEILVALYFNFLRIYPSDPHRKNRDRFILSKGHGCPALYAVLAKKGFISRKILEGFSRDKGTLERHPTRDVELGIECTSGSLGHGLSIGAGMALAAKANRFKSRICVLLGDGEINEGTIWETAMFASHKRLDNLIAIIDYNKIQALGTTYEILDLEPLADKWRAFGWGVVEIPGHDFKQILAALDRVPFSANRPSAIILHTVKGKGVSFMENNLLWHYRCPDEAEYAEALEELS